MHVNWKEGKPHITVNDYTDEADVSLALRYKSKNIKARCEPELFWAAATMITKKRKERFWLGVWQMILAMLPICVISGVVCSLVGNLIMLVLHLLEVI